MARALLLLGGGLLLAVLLAMLMTPIPVYARVLGPVLVTIAIGVAVMAVVARRTWIREREEQLQQHADLHDTRGESDRG